MFSIEAEFIGFADGKVSLRKADGKVIVLPLEKLSAADQAAAQQLAALPTAPAAEVPLDANKMPIATQVTLGTAPPVTAAAEKVPMVELGKAVDQFNRKTPWRAPTVTPAPPITLPPKVFDLNYSGWNNDDVHRLTVEPNSRCLWISCSHQGPDGNDYRLDRIDLTTGKFLTAFTLPEGHLVLAIDATGKRVVTIGNENLHLWKLDGDQLIREKSLMLVRKEGYTVSILSASTDTGAFIGTDHFALVNEHGLFVIRLSDFKPSLRICYADEKFKGSHLFLPGSRQMVIAYEFYPMLIDVLTGKIASVIELVGERVMKRNQLALSTDGRWMHMLTGDDKFHLCDLKSGEVKLQRLARHHRSGEVVWEGPPGWFRIGNRAVYDFNRELPLVEIFARPIAHLSAGGREFFLLGRSGQDPKVRGEKKGDLTLVCGEIPNAQQLAKSNGLKMSDYQIIKPGGKVALVYDAAMKSELEDKLQVSKRIKEKLAGSGVEFVTDATLATHEFRFTLTKDAKENHLRAVIVEKGTDKVLWEATKDQPLNPAEDKYLVPWFAGRIQLDLKDKLHEVPREFLFAVEVTPTGIRELSPEEQRKKNEAAAALDQQ